MSCSARHGYGFSGRHDMLPHKDAKLDGLVHKHVKCQACLAKRGTMDQKVIYVGEQTCRWVSSTGLLISCRGRNQFSRMRKCAAPSLRHCPRKCVAPSLRHCQTTTKHSGTVKETETVPYNAQCSEWQQCIVLVNRDDGVVHSNIHCNDALWVVDAWGGARIEWIFNVGRPCNWRHREGRNQCTETVYVRTSWCPNNTIPPNTIKSSVLASIRYVDSNWMVIVLPCRSVVLLPYNITHITFHCPRFHTFRSFVAYRTPPIVT
jgi:hypothetical protein